MKRIALQFVGLIRGFRFEKTRNKIFNNLILPLKNQGYEVDIFWHTYDIEFDDIVYKLDKDQFNIIKFKIDKDEEIQNFLKNELKLTNKFRFLPSWENAANKDTGTGNIVDNTYHHYGWFKFYNSIKHASLLREEYQIENNIEYEWIINTSPQVEPQNQIDDLTKLNNNYIYSPGYCHFGGYYDSFFIGNREIINQISKCYDLFISGEMNGCLIDAEPIFAWLCRNFKMMDILKIRFHRIRYNGLVIDH